MSTAHIHTPHAMGVRPWGALILQNVAPPGCGPHYVVISATWHKTKTLADAHARLAVAGQGHTRYAIAKAFL